MSKRVFTKVFHGVLAAEQPISIQFNAKETWLAQEDIEVVGAQASMLNTSPSENDGLASAEVELSQVGVIDTDGAIIKVVANEWWNTAPPGIYQTAGHTEVSFAPALAIPIKEEGLLYINASTIGKTADVSTFSYSIIVFYTKKGSR
ncbi:hypothetical protein ES705_44564 [subsurface metagenome]